MAFFYSRKNRQKPLQQNLVARILPKDIGQVYYIDFVLKDDTAISWAYLLKQDRDADLEQIANALEQDHGSINITGP